MRTIIPTNAVLIPEKAECVFTGRIYSVYQWQQKLFDGTEATFEMLKRPDSVKIIAIKDDKIVLLEQQQPNLPLFYDIPGGRHDDDSETELQAARRELLEETGLSFSQWRLLDVKQPYNKIDWLVYVFLAFELGSVIDVAADAGEKITVTFKTLDGLKKLVKNPKSRYLPRDIIESVNSISDLRELPPYLAVEESM